MEKRKKILVTATNYGKICKNGKKMLEDKGFEIIENTYDRPLTYAEQKELVKDIFGVVVGVDTWDEKIFREAFQLKIIARFRVGMDNIELEAARAHGITVANCAGTNSNAVSEHTVALLLGLVRKFPSLLNTTRQGRWERVVYNELNEMTVGLWGFGAIARFMAEKLKPFGTRLLAYDPYPDMQKAEQLGVTMVTQRELLKASDVISIHVPYLPSTHHMIQEDTIADMKDGVHIVNTARGLIIDEKALYQGLVSGKIAGAAIDVYEQEPVNRE